MSSTTTEHTMIASCLVTIVILIAAGIGPLIPGVQRQLDFSSQTVAAYGSQNVTLGAPTLFGASTTLGEGVH